MPIHIREIYSFPTHWETETKERRVDWTYSDNVLGNAFKCQMGDAVGSLEQYFH